MNDPVAASVDNTLKRLVDVANSKGGPSPVYLAVRPQMELAMRIWTFLPGNGNPMAKKDPQESLRALTVSGVVGSLEDIIAASDTITNAFNAYFGAGMRAFLAEVGEDSITDANPSRLFQVRFDNEVAEHNLLIESCTAYRQKVLGMAERYKIPLAAPTTTSTKAAPKTAKPNMFLRMFGEPVKPAGKGANREENIPLGWRTPPIFDPQSADVAFFDLIYPDAMQLEPDVFWQAAPASYGTKGSQQAVTDLLARVFAQINEQLELSRQIMGIAKQSFDLYQGCMIAGLEFQSKLVDLGKFYGFTVGKTSTPARKSR